MSDVLITNDSATILKKLDVRHPASELLAKTVDVQTGDGTTFGVILMGELLPKSVSSAFLFPEYNCCDFSWI